MSLYRLLALICGLMLLGNVRAAQLFFSTTDTFASGAAAIAASNSNPIFQFGLGSGTQHMYLWIKLAPDDAQHKSTERLNALGVDVVQEGQSPGPVAAAHATTYFMYGMTQAPVRWDVPGPNTQPGPTGAFEGVGSPTLAIFRRGAVTTLGLQSPAGGDVDTQSIQDIFGNWYMRVADISVVADQFTVQPIPIFLRTNTFVVAYDDRLPNHGPNIFFGAGDASVNPLNPAGGVQSALPDAVLVVIPEPSGLVALGLCLGWRRRSRCEVA